MITEYVQAAMHRAHYEFLANDKIYYGEIPSFDGVMLQMKIWKTAARN
jgi:hypothetical protein